MANLARSAARNDSDVQQLANAIGNPIRIDSVLRPKFRYRDEVDEIIRTPGFMLREGLEGDCDDWSTLTASLSYAMGYPTRLTAIAGKGPEEFDHVFSEYRANGSWIPIDLTVPVGTVYTCYKLISETV
jgi:transglutaminase-like putative cysteine protease